MDKEDYDRLSKEFDDLDKLGVKTIKILKGIAFTLIVFFVIAVVAKL